MGNTGSSSSGHPRRQRSNIPPPTPQPHQAELSGNRYVFAAATPYPTQYNRQPQYYPYPGYLPPATPPMAPPPQVVPGPYGPHYGQSWRGGGQFPYGGCPPQVLPYIEHQKAVTIRNDVNVKKESLKVEPDEENPGTFLVSFTYDATAPGRLTVVFFAKEGVDFDLTATREDILKPVTVSFQQGLGQRFRQLAGTGIDFSMLDEKELTERDGDIYPIVVKAEANPADQNVSSGHPGRNSQITQAVVNKEKGEYKVHVVKQILWVNGMRYELQEIYGIGNPADSDVDENDIGKECVICLSEQRDTTVLPCRHMCMCSGCAKVLRFQTNRCPICRQPVERLLEIKVNGKSN